MGSGQVAVGSGQSSVGSWQLLVVGVGRGLVMDGVCRKGDRMTELLLKIDRAGKCSEWIERFLMR
jgi:hypothetical protein